MFRPSHFGSLFLAAVSVLGIGSALSSPKDGLPEPVSPSAYDAFLNFSPFARSLNLSDSLILTGIARIGDETVVTLLNKETKESHVISDSPNSLGWRLQGVEGNQAGDLERVTVQVALQAGEVVPVRFAEHSIKRGESRPGSSGSGGSGSTKKPEAPPSSRSAEIVWRMEKLSEKQRTELFSRMEKFKKTNPAQTSEQVRDWFRGELVKLTGNG